MCDLKQSRNAVRTTEQCVLDVVYGNRASVKKALQLDASQ